MINEPKPSMIMTVKNELEHDFQSVYIYSWNESIDSLKIEKDEIDDVKWVSIREVYASINNGKNDKWPKISAMYASKFISHNFPSYI